MKRKNTLIAVAVLAVAAISISLIVSHQSANNNQTPKVHVPINVPLTGPIAAVSGQFANGFKFGIEDASRDLGVDPAIFVVDAQDNQANPAQALSIFQKQQLAGIDAYITVTTGAANAIAPLLDETGKPQFIECFDPFIVTGHPSRFRVLANSKMEAPLFIKYATDKKAKSVFIIQLDFSYAEDEMARIVEPALKSAGIATSKERYSIDQRDFKSIVQKVKQSNPDLVFLVGYSFHLQPLINDLRTAGILTSGNVMTCMDLLDLLHDDSPHDAFQGVVFASPYFDIPGKVPGAQAWRERYAKRFSVNPTYIPAFAYDTATLIVRAYKQQGKLTIDSIKAAVPFDGINGRIDFDADRDIVSTMAIATLDGKGQIVELK